MRDNGATIEEAVAKFFEIATDAWKDINEEYMRSSPYSRDVLMRILNLERIIDVTYKGNEDGYTQPEKVIDAKLNQKSDGKHASVSERKRNCDSEVSALRKLVKMERRRADAALAEVERERDASAMTVEEAMEMIQRLQHEKNSIEMAADQQRRLSEAKHVHDEEVIQSLESLLWSYEEELGLLRQQLGGPKKKLISHSVKAGLQFPVGNHEPL
ncbi:hypothetical protein SASPL_154845 [Salvia splendens]|uniref:GTD-binding domain-containing protein n=1 Tax=Salvia splendens TaxID=180675 RepID=A0A8X8YYU0_SALSN|nr:hypothetical protein SASPL_154845 [Salvia splendens]